MLTIFVLCRHMNQADSKKSVSEKSSIVTNTVANTIFFEH